MKLKIKKVLNKFYKVLPYILIIISVILLCINHYISKVLGKVNLYELIYYFANSKTGTNIGSLLDGIKSSIPLFILLIIIFILPIRKFKNKKLLIIYPIFILIVSTIILLTSLGIKEYIHNINKESKIYETHYKDTNNINIEFPEKKRNLIILYLESMESSLMSKENGGTFDKSRIKELEKLASENLNFSNTEKLGGGYNLTYTSWTIAATVATTSGTPLLSEIRNKYSKVKSFMPNTKTLGDILKEEGYNSELIQGSSRKFAGVDKYFKEHGDYKIFDLKTAKQKNYIDKTYHTWWGFEDKKLFKYAKKEITELASEDKPFAVSIFTMDTHFKDGYLDKSCEEPFNDQMSNVYACSSKMVNNFINWLKKQDFYENTTIVLIGDHLTMQNSYYKDYPNYTRTIYNTFINSEIETTNNKNREFTSLDMFPTILASLGAKIEGDQLGFGVNLFTNKKTLIEELGKENFNFELLKKSKYYNDIILADPILNKI